MKRIVVMLIIVMSILLCACGKEKNQSVNTDTIMSLLEETNKRCDQVNDLVVLSWETVGSQKVLSCLELMQSVTSAEDLKEQQRLIGWGSDWFYVSDIAEKLGFDVSSDRKLYSEDIESFYEICKNYRENCHKSMENLSKIEKEIKSIKNKNKEAYKNIKDYYLKTKAYADVVVNPSGSLTEYSNKVNEFKQNIKELKEEAELEL